MKSDENIRQRREKLPITYRLSLVTAFVVAAAGCGHSYQTFISDPGDLFEANYTTFEHPFTSAGEADAKRRAESQCAQKKRVAVQTSRACSLSTCTTSFQCMTPAGAAEHSQDDGRK
jgi:hypothetical protein